MTPTMTFLSKHWPKFVAALAILAMVFMVYAKGASDTRAAQAVENLKALKAARNAEQNAYAADAEKADAAINRLRALNVQIEGLNEYVNASPTAGVECLDSTDTDRLRHLWK